MNRTQSQQEILLIEDELFSEEFIYNRIINYILRFGYDRFSVNKVEEYLNPRIRNYLNWTKHKENGRTKRNN